MNFKDTIKRLTEYYHQEVIGIYEYLHAHPELSYKEIQTAATVQSYLEKWGIEFRSGIAGTGVLGIIKGNHPERKIIALRADMDALPIMEENQVAFKSKNAGVMHACGHDTHTASLLGVAQILQETKDRWSGTVLLVFQPGEEKHPGGARLMLEAGLFSDYQPDVVLAQHAFVDYAVGEVGFESGVIMAAADEVHFKIKGKGGHGAMPHLLNDTVLAASQCIVSLQQLVSRRSNPFNPVVLSFGKLLAAGDTNVIPDVVTVAGTLRTMNEDERGRLKELIKQTIYHTASAHGCECEIEVYDGYPCVINNESVTNKASRYASEYLGEKQVKKIAKRMTSEDFSFFSQAYPATFYRFGVKGDAFCGGGHTSRFLINSDALKTSVGTMAYLAYRFLEEV